MKNLSWVFFCLAPFALVCSENGNGLILCPLFIILGFVFKRSANKSGTTPTVRIKVERNEFWEHQYRSRIGSVFANKDSISDELMAFNDKEARDWATTICGYHNAWVPPKDKQEQIARANGVITEQMIEEKRIERDRIQIGKYFLLKELEEKYRAKLYKKKGRGERSCYPGGWIKRDLYKIKIYYNDAVSDYTTKRSYNMTVRQIWDDLTDEERHAAKNWIKEYEDKMLSQVEDYLKGGRNHYGVHIEF